MQRREHGRTPASFFSKMLFGKKEMPCTIVNISPGGAKLKITDAGEGKYPNEIDLDISPFGRFTVTVVWRSGEHLGVRFHDPQGKMAEVIMAMAVY